MNIFLMPSKTLWHLVKAHDTLFQSLHLPFSYFRGLQLKSNILENTSQVYRGLLGDFDIKNHKL